MGVDQAQWFPGWVSVEMASVPSFSLAYELGCLFCFSEGSYTSVHCSLPLY